MSPRILTSNAPSWLQQVVLFTIDDDTSLLGRHQQLKQNSAPYYEAMSSRRRELTGKLPATEDASKPSQDAIVVPMATHQASTGVLRHEEGTLDEYRAARCSTDQKNPAELKAGTLVFT